jgi:Asp-tRNA(Asn)/Glu-tRNA(Gln) amidotransferase C subunit
MIDLAEELNKIVGLFNNINLTDVLGVNRRSYNGRLTSR